MGPFSMPRVAWGSNVVDVGVTAGIKQAEYQAQVGERSHSVALSIWVFEVSDIGSRIKPSTKYINVASLTLGFTGGSVGKESACNAGDLVWIPGLGRSPGGRHGNPLQYSCLENPHGQRILMDCSPWCCKESGMTE